MKVITFILALYLFVLSGIACCTFDCCPDNKTIAGQTSSQDNGEDDGCGSCSPFFRCEGCMTLPMVVEAFSFPAHVIAVSQSYPDFIIPFVSNVTSDFWQPPKFS